MCLLDINKVEAGYLVHVLYCRVNKAQPKLIIG